MRLRAYIKIIVLKINYLFCDNSTNINFGDMQLHDKNKALIKKKMWIGYGVHMIHNCNQVNSVKIKLSLKFTNIYKYFYVQQNNLITFTICMTKKYWFKNKYINFSISVLVSAFAVHCHSDLGTFVSEALFFIHNQKWNISKNHNLRQFGKFYIVKFFYQRKVSKKK